MPNNSVKYEVCKFENLYHAMLECKKNTMWKDSVTNFYYSGFMRVHKLRRELLDGTYKILPYSIFVVHEKKTRTIVATRFRDRVVQKSLCDCYFYKEITKGFIYDNCACLLNKGTDFARNRLICHLNRYYRKYGNIGYCLKVDIHDYFGSTPHIVAKRAVAKRVKDEWARSMVFNIIDSFNHISPDVGMGLGSQITQLVELAVLDDLDHMIKEQLHIKYYVRYMDDLILIHNDKEYLKKCKSVIESEIQKLGLTASEKKTYIMPLNNGIHFLGFSYRLTSSGKVVKKILHKKVKKERRKLKKLVQRQKDGILTRHRVDECFKSWKAHAKKGNCHNLMIKMEIFYENLYLGGKHD